MIVFIWNSSDHLNTYAWTNNLDTWFFVGNGWMKTKPVLNFNFSLYSFFPEDNFVSRLCSHIRNLVMWVHFHWTSGLDEHGQWSKSGSHWRRKKRISLAKVVWKRKKTNPWHVLCLYCRESNESYYPGPHPTAANSRRCSEMEKVSLLSESDGVQSIRPLKSYGRLSLRLGKCFLCNSF